MHGTGMSNPNYTELYINYLKSENGGWNIISLAMMDIKWPPKKGWKKRLIKDDALSPYDNRFFESVPIEKRRRLNKN